MVVALPRNRLQHEWAEDSVDAESGGTWQLEIIGGAIVTDPDGNETCFPGRFIWTIHDGLTVRLLLFLDGQDCPVMRVVSPVTKKVGTTAAAALATFVGTGS